jgi:hypothetical protein
MIAAIADPRPLAPAVYLGLQDGFGVSPDFEIYNLTAPLGDHPEHSTVSRETLEAAGYRVPAPRDEE